MCEARMVRFVHVMENDRYEHELRVGCVCAGHMEEDVEGPAIVKLASRLRGRGGVAGSRGDGGPPPRWDAFLNTTHGVNVVVYRRGGIWRARVEHRDSGLARSSRRPYATANAAKLAAFDAMLGMKHAEPWRSQRVSDG